MNDTLVVCEIFRSIQGESTRAGLPCVFIRLTGCNLSCTWCDSEYARTEGTPMHIEKIIDTVERYDGTLVEITGGEPLAQERTIDLIRQCISRGKTVLLETNGSYSIKDLPAECIGIIDVKCPSSGETDSFLKENIGHLRPYDELKFVIGSRADFDWACTFIKTNSLEKQGERIFSPVAGAVRPETLAAWILETNIPVRMQLQLHKIIWGDKRGV